MANLRRILKYSFRHDICSVTGISNKKLNTSGNGVDQLNSNAVVLKKAITQCRKEIKKSRRWKIIPSPICFEHAAMLSRQNKNYQNEIKICQLYLSCVDECLSKRTFNKKRAERKAHSLCKPFTSRLLIAKDLYKNSGIDVNYL